jgi:DNA-binding transcriptional regulator YdaS (Cro superfamily)
MTEEDYNITETGFKKRVADYVCYNDGGAKKLAREFEVALSTVSRWCRGASCPHPGRRAQIARFIKGQNNERD